MKRAAQWLAVSATIFVVAALYIAWRFDADIKEASANAALGSVLTDTRCGPIEYQEAGTGTPILVVHGSGGGHDRGMALAAPLAAQGIRVIAMSRFGYLRTPMPIDATPAAQADAHACLLDALGIRCAAVMGYSVGGPSALQMAIRHPDRVNALVLLMPIAYQPPTHVNTVPPLSPWVEGLMLRLSGSDFLVWAALKSARASIIKLMLATPPELVKSASAPERRRVNAILDGILPVSARATGLKNDTETMKHLSAEPLASIRAPTLIISARDDGYSTYPSAQYTASKIKDAKFMGFEHGGHVWVGHDDEVMTEIVKLLFRPVQLIQHNTTD